MTTYSVTTAHWAVNEIATHDYDTRKNRSDWYKIGAHFGIRTYPRTNLLCDPAIESFCHVLGLN